MNHRIALPNNHGILFGLTAAMLLTAGISTTATAASPNDAILGQWRSKDRGGITQFQSCGNAICGQVIDGASLRANPDLRDVKNSDKNLRSRKVKGLIVLQNFKGGPHEWNGGPLYDPDRGMGVANGTIKLIDQNTLKVTGCFARFICQSEIMTRIR